MKFLQVQKLRRKEGISLQVYPEICVLIIEQQ